MYIHALNTKIVGLGFRILFGIGFDFKKTKDNTRTELPLWVSTRRLGLKALKNKKKIHYQFHELSYILQVSLDENKMFMQATYHVARV